jgi:hypothetical protein
MEETNKHSLLKSRTNETNTNKLSIFLSILISIKSGINGAMILFGLLVSAKLLSFFTTSGKDFNITVNDLIISFWGFAIVSFIVLAELFKDSE